MILPPVFTRIEPAVPLAVAVEAGRAGFSAARRRPWLSAMALVVGAISSLVGWALLWLSAALRSMLRENVGRLPVVEPAHLRPELAAQT